MVNKVDNALSSWKTPFDEKEKSWDAIAARIAEKETKVVSLWPKVLAAAASIAIIFGLFLFNQDAQSIHTTSLAQHETITLPDGSTAELNAGSTLRFAEEWTDLRAVELEGEAFFRVKKGSRFTVLTANGDVQVLGTSFNVFSRDDEMKVVCKTGKVKVSTDDDEVILTPGLATETDAKELKDPYARENANGWMIGELEYEDEPISHVFAELERQFGIGIAYSGALDVRFSGPVLLDDLESALSIVCDPEVLMYEVRDESTVIITQK